MTSRSALLLGPLALVVVIALCARSRPAKSVLQVPVPLVTGKSITPAGDHTPIGSFPVNMVVSPDGRFLAVTCSGFHQYLSILGAADGRVLSQIEVGKPRSAAKLGLYYGLAFGPAVNGGYLLYASRGAEEKVAVYEIDPRGIARDTGRRLESRFVNAKPQMGNVVAGIALNSDGTRLYTADNNTSLETELRGSLTIVDTANGRQIERVSLPGFPFGVTAITSGPDRDRKVYVSSERDAVVAVVDPVAMRRLRDIRVGANPTSLVLDRSQKRLFVSNSGSDTISIVDTHSDRVTRTILLRPGASKAIPGATPLGLTLSADETRLYVALADMNAVAVVDLAKAEVVGYIPVGWYPTSCAVSPDGTRLFVTNAKGTARRNPNGKEGPRGRYIQDIIEGTAAVVQVPSASDLSRMTAAVLNNNGLTHPPADDFRNPGIEHVIYIIKENRTYDQVLGDLPQGNGDPTLTLFPREVTPNLHALAERFVLMDNFYCCAEVSADGWNWSTSSMSNEYVTRNAPYNYSGRGRSYDYEGQNNGVPVDLLGLNDVARSPGGYIWDRVIRQNISMRNYGFFASFKRPETRSKEGPETSAAENQPNKKALIGLTDLDYRLYDLKYPDSDAWEINNHTFASHVKSFGRFQSTSRFQQWKREYDEFVTKQQMPRFMMVRFGNDHTQGTSAGVPSPRAYVAENDFAVGQLVERVSKGPYWKKTAIIIVEDDAQNGHDHVDAHRSIAFCISPFVKNGTVDSRFYNTASALRTIGLLLGTKPLCQYDAIARPYAFFTTKPSNDAQYEAILPPRRIVTELNSRTAYRAGESAKMAFAEADAVDDDALSSLIWHAVKGANTPEPAKRYGVTSGPRHSTK